MPVSSSFSDYQPITWWKRLPIYATTILTALYALGLIVSILLMSARVPLNSLVFDPRDFLSGSVWQAVTYSFVDRPTFFTLFGMLCLYSWGVEVEKYLGRVRYLKLFALLLLVQPLVCCILRWTLGVSSNLAGNYQLVAALLIAFATLYPNIEYFGWIPLKWFAFACFTIGSLMYFPARDWVGLSVLWAACGSAFGFVRHVQRGGSVEASDFIGNPFRRRPNLRVVRDEPGRPRPRSNEKDAVDSIDPLLDKIAKSGMSSLTGRERAKLEKARAALMKKENGDR